MSGYSITPEAEHDLDSIADYMLSVASVEQTMKVLAKIRAEMRKLARSPGMGHYREELLDRRYKFWLVYSYLIVYRWDVKPIQIIAVVHGARDLEAWFGRRRGE